MQKSAETCKSWVLIPIKAWLKREFLKVIQNVKLVLLHLTEESFVSPNINIWDHFWEKWSNWDQFVFRVDATVCRQYNCKRKHCAYELYDLVEVCRGRI